MENTSHATHPFRRLFQIDVSKHVEKKGLFPYLGWPFAVAQLRLADPDASWEVRFFDGLLYLSSELGFFVDVAVTVQGVTPSRMCRVLDNKNRPILAPTPFDIHTSIQHCQVKAIALHRLGLSIYAGEDLPDLENAGNTGNSGKTGEGSPEVGACGQAQAHRYSGQGHESANQGGSTGQSHESHCREPWEIVVYAQLVTNGLFTAH